MSLAISKCPQCFQLIIRAAYLKIFLCLFWIYQPPHKHTGVGSDLETAEPSPKEHLSSAHLGRKIRELLPKNPGSIFTKKKIPDSSLGMRCSRAVKKIMRCRLLGRHWRNAATKTGTLLRQDNSLWEGAIIWILSFHSLGSIGQLLYFTVS